MIIDSLHYWVQEMHVDGFRFDLASILTRDKQGMPLANPPVLWDIETDPVGAGIKLIAEAWDAAGLYQVGSFIGDSWKEWNGRFRDDVRSFLKGDKDTVSKSHPACWQSISMDMRSGRRAEHQFRTCMTGLPLMTWSHITASITRPTAKTTGTAAMTT
jgi:glycogen operon protein